MPNITYKNKSVFFIHIPKTSGTSLYANLKRQGAIVEDYRPWTPAFETVSSHHLDRAQLDRYYKKIKNEFTVVRDPWKRTLSEYVYKTRDSSFTKLNKWLAINLILYKKYPCIQDNHIKPMTKFIGKDTKIFSFENLPKMYFWICDQLDHRFDFSFIQNQSVPYNYVKIEDVLDDYVAELWYNQYSKDIELYNSIDKT